MAAINRPGAAIGSARRLLKRPVFVRRYWAVKLSLLVHVLLILVLAWLLIPQKPARQQISLLALQPEVEPVTVALVPTAEPTGVDLFPAPLASDSPPPAVPEIISPRLPSAAVEIAIAPVKPVEMPTEVPGDLPTGGGLAGREPEARAQLVLERGGTPQSEAAVERGLAWLVAHQLDDGSWRFDHHLGPCDGTCRNSGREKSTTAATAMALLPFLAAGQTHVSGQHRDTVARGLAYLQGKLIASPRGGDLQDGTMYGQGLATIALSEAAAMTGDPELRESAQAGIKFIVSVQHPAGGWRYYPHQAGDTTVVGWQWMALRSGQLAGLDVPSETIHRAGEFLDTIQLDGGAGYGYQHPDTQPTSTAIGLLCRMYGGWRRSDPRLARGVQRLAAIGPSYDDMYFNYHAAQVLHHYAGQEWQPWNDKLREHLVATQALRGYELGSWHFADPHTASGGRLCDTALCLLTLEVYYRYLPLYGPASVGH